MPVVFGATIVCRSCKGKGIYKNNGSICRSCDGTGLTATDGSRVEGASSSWERQPPPVEALSAPHRAVIAFMSDHKLHSGVEIASPRVGGSEGLRRVRELRDMGFPIEGPFPIPGSRAFAYRLRED